MTKHNRTQIRRLEEESKKYDTYHKPIRGINYRGKTINKELKHRYALENFDYATKKI